MREVRQSLVRTHLALYLRSKSAKEVKTPGEHLSEHPEEHLRALLLRAVLHTKLKTTWPGRRSSVAAAIEGQNSIIVLQLTKYGQLELLQQLSIPSLALPTALQVQAKISVCTDLLRVLTTCLPANHTPQNHLSRLLRDSSPDCWMAL